VMTTKNYLKILSLTVFRRHLHSYIIKNYSKAWEKA
jgi:hypothetical protein